MTARHAMEDTVEYFQLEMEDIHAQCNKLAALYAEGLAKRHALSSENGALRLEIIELKKALEQKASTPPPLTRSQHDGTQ